MTEYTDMNGNSHPCTVLSAMPEHPGLVFIECAALDDEYNRPYRTHATIVAPNAPRDARAKGTVRELPDVKAKPAAKKAEKVAEKVAKKASKKAGKG